MSHLPRTSASHHFGSNRTIPDQSLCCIGPTCVGFTARPHPSTPAATAPPIYSLHSVRVSLLRLPFAADTPNGTESPTQRWCIALARSLLLFLRHYVPFCTRHRRRRLYRLTCRPAIRRAWLVRNRPRRPVLRQARQSPRRRHFR